MIGTKVGRYTIAEEIGDGGHAFIFKGTCGDDEVAIKMLKPSIADQDNLEDRFVLEAEALKKLQHPHIVEFKDYVYQNGYHYLMLEYMDQGSVEDLIKTMGPIPARYAVPIFFHVVDAIRFSHDAGYIHRDLKPNNILINSEGEAKLTDFGITKVVGGQNLTRKGYVLGTTLYMAPEFISQGVVSVKTDVYALGVTFYEMLTGRKPYEFEREDEPLVNFARRVCKEPPTPPSEYRAIPEDLERIVLKSIAQNPKDRYKSAKDFHRDLAKSFPDLVERDVVIPSGRAMTRYVNINELFEGENPGMADSGGGSRRKATAFTVAAVVLVLALVAPFVMGDDAPRMAIWGGGAALAALSGFIAWTLAGRKESPPPMPAPAFTQDADSSIDESAEESAIPEFEDTIPFHRGGGAGQKPFKMTEASELNAYLVVIEGPDKGRRFGLRPVSRIGRDLRLDIRPHDPEISRHHAVLTFDGRGFFAEDLGSTNGTFINDERLVGKRRISHGDLVRCGTSSMRFEFAEGGGAAA